MPGIRGPRFEQKVFNFEPDAVSVIRGEDVRYIPQWDLQLHGSLKVTRKNALEWPPKPDDPTSLTTCFCSKCSLTWLSGAAGQRSGKDHPRHVALPTSKYQARDGRSILLYANGAVVAKGKGNGKAANSKDAGDAGVGIYFGQGSQFNVSERVSDAERTTVQTTELAAVAKALETVRLKVLPHRRDLIDRRNGDNDVLLKTEAKYMRVIVATDSSYVVNGIVAMGGLWKWDEEQLVFINKRGEVLKNSEAFMKIKQEVELLAETGVQVMYYLVQKRFNKEAAALAQAALR